MSKHATTVQVTVPIKESIIVRKYLSHHESVAPTDRIQRKHPTPKKAHTRSRS